MVDDRPYLVRSAGATDPGYFRLWALEAVAGTLFGAAEMAQGAPVAVISEAAARQLFGSAEDALDRELMLLSVEEGLLLQGLLAGFPSGTTPPPRAVFRVVGVYRFPSADPETVDLRRPEIIVPMGWLTAQHGKPAGPFSDPFADVLYVSAPMEQELAVQQALEVLLSPLLTERRRLQGGEEARSRSSWQLEVVRGGQAQLLREQHRARAAVVSGLVFAGRSGRRCRLGNWKLGPDEWAPAGHRPGSGPRRQSTAHCAVSGRRVDGDSPGRRYGGPRRFVASRTAGRSPLGFWGGRNDAVRGTAGSLRFLPGGDVDRWASCRLVPGLGGQSGRTRRAAAGGGVNDQGAWSRGLFWGSGHVR